MIIGVVLAAGRGARFATADASAPPKMLAPIDGVPMVRRTVSSLVAGGADRCVVVVAAGNSDAIGGALDGLPVSLVNNPDPSRGMFSSVQCGMAAAGDADLCLLLPGDMPYVLPATVAAVIAAAQRTGRSVVPTLDGHRAHPLACSRALRARLMAAPVDSRLDLETAHDTVVTIVVTDPGVRRDVDVP